MNKKKKDRSRLFSSNLGTCLICGESGNSVTFLEIQQLNHICSSRRWFIHSSCVKPTLEKCTCPQYPIEHDTDSNHEPLYRFMGDSEYQNQSI